MRHVVLGFAIGLVSVPAFADEVTVKDVHLCCGACVKAADEALKEVKGVTAVKIDKDAGTVTFTVADRKRGRAALKKLAEAGFGGQATMGDKKLGFPKLTVEKGTTADSLQITGVHLCCGGCVKAVQGALKDVQGVSNVEGDTDTGVVKIEGDDVDVRQVLQTLRKAGFNGKAAL